MIINNSSPKKLIVHPGIMHADDVMTAAFLTNIFPGLIVERPLDTDITEEMKNDPEIMICDVGKEYDPSRNLYDHHNECPLREDGMPHSALGLVLMNFRDMIGDAAFEKMKNDIDMIEHIDNGQPDEMYDLGTFNIINLVRVMNPTWNSASDPDEFLLVLGKSPS